MRGFLKEFRDFAIKGNLIEIAVGLVLALAFTALVNAFIADLVTPIVAALAGKADFSRLSFSVNGSIFKYGAFVNAAITFVTVALVLFLIVKAYNRVRRPPAAAPSGPSEVDLLVEIRDALQERGR